mgnify:CR=1 FL=1
MNHSAFVGARWNAVTLNCGMSLTLDSAGSITDAVGRISGITVNRVSLSLLKRGSCQIVHSHYNECVADETFTLMPGAIITSFKRVSLQN